MENFDKVNIKEDGFKLLKKRLELNKINPKYLIKDKICVDADADLEDILMLY